MCDFDNDDDEETCPNEQQQKELPNVMRHLSECAISLGREYLGCTCFDDSPEWSL